MLGQKGLNPTWANRAKLCQVKGTNSVRVYSANFCVCVCVCVCMNM